VKILKIIVLFSFVLTFVFGDYLWTLAQQPKPKYSVLFALKPQGISESAYRMLIEQLQQDPSISRDVRFIELNEMNLTLAANNKSRLSYDSSIDDITEAAKFVGVRWVITGALKRIRAMHMVTLNIIDVDSEKTIDSIREDEPGTIEEMQSIIISNVIKKLIELVIQENAKMPVTAIKKKKSRAMYYILGVLAAVGTGAAIALGGKGGGGGSPPGPSDLPGSPPGPPNK